MRTLLTKSIVTLAALSFFALYGWANSTVMTAPTGTLAVQGVGQPVGPMEPPAPAGPSQPQGPVHTPILDPPHAM
jgi:hypothetical protein